MTLFDKLKLAIATITFPFLVGCGSAKTDYTILDRIMEDNIYSTEITPEEAISMVSSPEDAKGYILGRIDYDYERADNQENGTHSFKTTHNLRKGVCRDGAVAIAALLQDNGYKPLILSICDPERGGHDIFVYQKEDKWGSAGINAVDFIEPEFETLEQLIRAHSERFNGYNWSDNNFKLTELDSESGYINAEGNYNAGVFKTSSTFKDGILKINSVFSFYYDIEGNLIKQVEDKNVYGQDSLSLKYVIEFQDGQAIVKSMYSDYPPVNGVYDNLKRWEKIDETHIRNIWDCQNDGMFERDDVREGSMDDIIF